MRFVLIGFVAAIVLGGRAAKADFTFGEITNLGPTVNTGASDAAASLSADGLTLFFSSNRTGGMGKWDLCMVTRETVDGDWGPATNLGPTVNHSSDDWGASISTDGLELYFRSGRNNQNDLLVTRRETINSDWGTPVNLGPTVNSAAKDAYPSISSDGLELYFSSLRSGGFGRPDIWVTQRLTKDDPWQAPVNLGPTLNTAGDDYAPDITDDGLTLIFSSGSPTEWSDLCATTRRTTADPWREPFNLGPVINANKNVNKIDYADISPDGTMLYITCYNRPGGYGDFDIWQAPIIPIVDFNGDMFVDSADMCIMVDNWGKDEPLCDIAPMPFGDGIVDIKDLIALAEHLPPAFLAHWELDETEGSIAYDSVGGHDGMLNGNPLWQPAGGKTGGAIQLDGIDDYVSADFVWEIWKMKISASAWIKGGAPGQVIISQADGMGYGAAWLYADSSSGTLVTRLMDPQPELVSESVISDGTWHHIGLVWDGSYRYLYVDGAEVARDAAALNYTIACDGGLYLGAGKYLDAGSFFSGLIDDVRIYRKALSAEEIEALTQ